MSTLRYSALLFEDAPTTQTLEPTGLTSAEAFGSAGVIQTLKPSAISSAEAFGTPARTVFFPEGLTNAVDGETEIIAAHLNNVEAKIGIDNSEVTSSIDYRLNAAELLLTEGYDPGHSHTDGKIIGASRGLEINVLSDTLVSLQADELVVSNPTDDHYLTLRDIELEIDLAVDGAGGLDLNSEIYDAMWHAVFVAYKPATSAIAGLFHVYLDQRPVITIPPALNANYVKATSAYASHEAYKAVNPLSALLGASTNICWISNSAATNQRFHVDLGSAKVIKKFYVENSHSSGTETDCGAKNFTLWGSNVASAFSTTTYATDTDWTQLTCDVTQFNQHNASDRADPQLINVTNTTAYRYYGFKFADNWGDATFLGVRRIDLFCLPTGYRMQLPPAFTSTYTKATSNYDANYTPPMATDPTKSLTGSATGNTWIAGNTVITNQRFHIDLGVAKIMNRIYYENYHHSGANPTQGVQNFTLWGSNSATAFAEMTYATDTDWTQLTCESTAFTINSGTDQQEPHFINFTSTTPYRYYAFKFADNHGHATLMGVRRIELHTAPEGSASLVPTLPTGYTHYALVGWVVTDTTGKLRRSIQRGEEAQYRNVGAGLPLISSGATGAYATPTWYPLSIELCVPPTAKKIDLLLKANATIIMVSPNTACGAYDSLTKPPPLCANSAYNVSETGAIFWERENSIFCASEANTALFCKGWG